jgi:toxin ParE1/3/4
LRSVRLSRVAQGDIERLTEFLESKSERAAARAADAITSAILSLAEFAERGRPSKHLGFRELVVRFGHSGYVIRYRVDGESVFVTRVFHGLERR